MTTAYFESPDGHHIAYRCHDGTSGLTFVWLSGFKSDMMGGKVTELEAWAKAADHSFLAFDYSGHGQSGGTFRDGTISSWRADALAAIRMQTKGDLVLVGSSMGGWIMLLAALARPAPHDPRVADRFELFICGLELANAFGELTDATEQRRRFEADLRLRRELYGTQVPIDEDFMAALETGLPQSAGIALGFDRLVMLATGAQRIEAVLWAPVAE